MIVYCKNCKYLNIYYSERGTVYSCNAPQNLLNNSNYYDVNVIHLVEPQAQNVGNNCTWYKRKKKWYEFFKKEEL